MQPAAGFRASWGTVPDVFVAGQTTFARMVCSPWGTEWNEEMRLE
jgi:hypothetical protein